ncbi:hypothetical protein MRX96_004997 [Rhipicephalus microplus]
MVAITAVASWIQAATNQNLGLAVTSCASSSCKIFMRRKGKGTPGCFPISPLRCIFRLQACAQRGLARRARLFPPDKPTDS